MNPDQIAPLGAVWSAFIVYDSMLKVLYLNIMQQKTVTSNDNFEIFENLFYIWICND